MNLIKKIALNSSDLMFKNLQENLIKMQDCLYQTIFIGVNQNEINYEAKLYYISKYRGRKIYDNSKSQIFDAISLLEIDDYFSGDLFSYLNTANIYLEGIAYSLSEKPIYRLYFKQIPQRFIL